MKKIIFIEIAIFYAIISLMRGGNMKYTFRKFKMMHASLKQVKGDKFRSKETRLAVVYMFMHPSHLFEKKKLNSNYNSVLKAVNVMTNYPYNDKLYYSVVK